MHEKWKKWLGLVPSSPYPELGLVTPAFIQPILKDFSD